MVHRAKIAQFARASTTIYVRVAGVLRCGRPGQLRGQPAGDLFRLAAYADRLLRGERPDTLPIERASIFEFMSISGRRATSASTSARTPSPC